MGRLILVPQYPTVMRYQEWWFHMFPAQLQSGFSEILVLGKRRNIPVVRESCSSFSPMEQAILFELSQIDEYVNLELQTDDTLLLNDLSYPGLFSQVLIHKRPKKCFAICHATSKNRFDYFQKVRHVKYPIEKATAKLFDAIFVGSQYHKEKLGWTNCVVSYLPFPPFPRSINQEKKYSVVTVSRKGIQKRNFHLEKEIGFPVHSETPSTWEQYFLFLSQAYVLLITSKEETFGYQVVDAILNNCIPIAPNTCCYAEFLPKEYLFDTAKEAQRKITDAMLGNLPVPRLLVEKGCHVFYETILKKIKSA